MSTIIQGVASTLIGALIMGATTYTFIIHENQILISVLSEKFRSS